METTATIISAAIAAISAIVAIWTVVVLYLKIKNSKNITFTKKVNGEKITISQIYNREDSKRLMEFMK